MSLAEDMDKVEQGMRSATHLIDSVARLTGVPFRPTWAQSMKDGWESAATVRQVLEQQERRKSIMERDDTLDNSFYTRLIYDPLGETRVESYGRAEAPQVAIMQGDDLVDLTLDSARQLRDALSEILR